METYCEAVKRIRTPLPASPEMIELVRYATLAANGHNVQPWLFKVSDQRLSILPDLTRRTPIVDPDDHHLFVSLGCACENLLLASRAAGRPGALAFDQSGLSAIDIDLARAEPSAGVLFAAITERQSTRAEFDGRAVSNADLAALEEAAAEDGVYLVLLTDVARRDVVLDYVIEGNNSQMEDPAFVDELKEVLRFNAYDALRTGDGLFSACSGNPTLPSWVGRTLFGLLYRKRLESKKYTKQVRSSAGIAVFVGGAADPDHWIKVGRSFQRFALQATALGIKHSHINQPIEVPKVRRDFAGWLETGGLRPDLVIRFGYGDALPMSMRRPAGDLIVAG